MYSVNFGHIFSLIAFKTRYTDTHILSRQRDLSIKSAPMSLVLSTTSGKSHLIHFIDTPGHINFVDEVASAARLVDGILLVVDVVEGVCFSKIGNLQAYNYILAYGGDGIRPQACFARRRHNYSGCE
jgi:translation elongation factor EF-G